MQTVKAVVAQNVSELRALRGLSVRALSARMGELGRPVLASGISKIEKGERGVSADDLVALAVALDVSPVRLLLPASPHGEVQLSPDCVVSWDSAWRWGVGEEPLVDDLRHGDPRTRAFIGTSRPFESDHFPDEIVRGLAAREPAPWTLHARFDGEEQPEWSFTRGSGKYVNRMGETALGDGDD